MINVAAHAYQFSHVHDQESCACYERVDCDGVGYVDGVSFQEYGQLGVYAAKLLTLLDG